MFSIQIVDVQKWWFNCKHHCGHEQGFPRNGVSCDFFVFFLYGQCLSPSVNVSLVILNSCISANLHISCTFYNRELIRIDLQKQST